MSATPRIHLDAPLAVGARLALPDAAARHVSQVLRLRVGQALILFDGRGLQASAVMVEVQRRSVMVEIESTALIDRESPLAITLVQAVSKGERMDWAIQKAVELGVHQIVPLVCERSVVKLSDERWQKKQAHWQGVIVSACEQCGRNRLPDLATAVDFRSYLAEACDASRWILAPGEQAGWPAQRPEFPLQIMVGPEGGFSDAEIAAAIKAGVQPVAMGPRVLRTETAAVAALSAIHASWGDWRRP